MNRERAGGWTGAKERRFLDALAATRDVPLAALQVGISAVSAYRHRMRWPAFAERWREALADDVAFADSEWVGTLICMLEGERVPDYYPVQTIGIGDVIRLHERSLGVRRGRPMRLLSPGRVPPSPSKGEGLRAAAANQRFTAFGYAERHGP